ncbi:MAG: flavodoxin family protein [Clostridiales bacterium]|nr:flavodoxin family protein [Clostridiales bacterium]
MKILVLTGSPHQKGSSNMLAEYFVKGAREAGNMVGVIDCAHLPIRPCSGCLACGYNGPCVQKDEMEKVRPHVLTADMLVFVTPLYYYGMTAQLKVFIDRLCSINKTLQSKQLRSALISVATKSDDWTFDSLVFHYKTLAKYLNMTDVGMVLGKGCSTPDKTAHSQYPAEAYEFGKRMR